MELGGKWPVESDEVAETEVVVESAFAIVDALLDTEKAFMRDRFKAMFSSPTIKGRVREALPCLYANALLSLSGKETTKETLEAVLSTVSIKIDPPLVASLCKEGIKSHLLYIYAYYFLLAFGKQGTTKEILNVVRSLGNDAEEQRAVEVLTFLKSLDR